MRRLKAGVVVIALAAWGAVLTGTWTVYPWYRAVGPLAGKTGLSVIIWLVAWAVLYGLTRSKPMSVKRVLPISLVLIGLGVLGTFPTFFQLFAAD